MKSPYTEAVMRLFVGIPLKEDLIRELIAMCGRLRTQDDSLRWSAPESWHITLQFLGNTTAEQLERLKARLAEVRSAPVPAQLGALGVFERAGVFFAEVEVVPQLMALQKRVAEATAKCGFEPEDRPYHPHITLARTKGDGGRRQLKALLTRMRSRPDFPRFVAHEFLLYESHLGAGGSKYEVQSKFLISG